jgi:hypothetical protein
VSRRKKAEVDQDELRDRLVDSFHDGTLESDEYDALYEQLDIDHKIEVGDAAREFAADAVGDDHWQSDA